MRGKALLNWHMPHVGPVAPPQLQLLAPLHHPRGRRARCRTTERRQRAPAAAAAAAQPSPPSPPPAAAGAGSDSAAAPLEWLAQQGAAVGSVERRYLGPELGWGETQAALVGLAAFLGHLWPVFFRFQGGKGVATAAGVLLAFEPVLGLATLGSWLLVAFFLRYSSLAAIVASAFAPFYHALIWGPSPATGAILAMSALLIWRHQANIRKLLAGTESRIGQKPPVSSADATPGASDHAGGGPPGG